MRRPSQRASAKLAATLGSVLAGSESRILRSSAKHPTGLGILRR